MPELTQKLKIPKPLGNEYLTRAAFNEILEAIDSGAVSREELTILLQAISDTQEDVVAHQAKKASLTEAGHVQLSSATNSVDETTAATPKAVKAAMDRADEAFTLGNSTKQSVVDKLLLLDPSLPITVNNSWQEIINAMSGVKTGKKWASGTAVVSSNKFSVTGLGFTPSVITWSNAQITGARVGIYRNDIGSNYISFAHTSQNNTSKFLAISGNVTITNDGFTVDVGTIESNAYWIAYE